MHGLDLLTQIDTNRFGFQSPNEDGEERILPIEDRSAYRDALNRSLKDTPTPRRTDPSNSVDSANRNRRPEIPKSTDNDRRIDRPENTLPSRPEPTSSAENSHADENENRPEIPQTVLDRLATNVAQIVPGLDDFPKTPPGIAENINPVIQILFEVGTEVLEDNSELDLQIDIEEIPVVPEGLLEAIGQFDQGETEKNPLEFSVLLVDELHDLETLIQSEISTELPLQESVEIAANIPTQETNVENEVVAQFPVLKTADGLEQSQPPVSVENVLAETEQSQNILPLNTTVEENPSEEIATNTESDVEKTEIEFSISQDFQSENIKSDDTAQTTIPVSQPSEQISGRIVDTTPTDSDDRSAERTQTARPSFANFPSKSSNSSQTGQVASQVSEDGPLPSPQSQVDTAASDSKVSIQGSNVKETTPSAVRAVKEQNNAQLIERVAQSVRVSQQTGRTMKFRLQPPELGTLQVEIKQNDGVLTARLEVQTAAAQKAITDNMAQLREAIQQLGTRIEQIDVQLVETRNEDHPSNQSQERGQGQKENSEDRDHSRNRHSNESETDSGEEDDIGSQAEGQVDIQV